MAVRSASRPTTPHEKPWRQADPITRAALLPGPNGADGPSEAHQHDHGGLALPVEASNDQSTVEQLLAETKRLRKALQQAELERDILKKATAYFAKESQ